MIYRSLTARTMKCGISYPLRIRSPPNANDLWCHFSCYSAHRCNKRFLTFFILTIFFI